MEFWSAEYRNEGLPGTREEEEEIEQPLVQLF